MGPEELIGVTVWMRTEWMDESMDDLRITEEYTRLWNMSRSVVVFEEGGNLTDVDSTE